MLDTLGFMCPESRCCVKMQLMACTSFNVDQKANLDGCSGLCKILLKKRLTQLF